MPEDESGGQFGGGQMVDLPTELKKWAEAIKATTEAIDAVAKTLEEHATRSVILEVNNTTNHTLFLYDSGDHDWGGFRQLPPDSIPPHQTGLFTSQSNGLATGTQGSVKYRIDDEGTIFHLEWSNPFIGDNDSLCRVEGTHPDFYLTHYVTGSGNTKAHIQFIVGEKADASPRQRDWKTCKNCKGLFFSLDDGLCAAHPLGIVSAPTPEMLEQMQAPPPAGITERPAGGFGIFTGQAPSPSPTPPRDPATAGMEMFGKHEAAGDEFQLPYRIPGRNRFAGWRQCKHCKGLFYDGQEKKGVCPGRRGGHVALSEEPNFHLKYGMPPLASQQENWRFCDKCFGLFFLPQNADSVCPAGGNHHAQSDSYVLDRL